MIDPEKAPTGMPDDAEEAPPLGVQPDDDADDDDDAAAMPGIPTEREPPTAG